MDIDVVYTNGEHESVPDLIFELSLRLHKVKYFWRPSELRWVNVAVDPIRSGATAGEYNGPERRKLPQIRRPSS